MFLAIEFGGTKLQMALGLGQGKLLALWREKVDPKLKGDLPNSCKKMLFPGQQMENRGTFWVWELALVGPWTSTPAKPSPPTKLRAGITFLWWNGLVIF